MPLRTLSTILWRERQLVDDAAHEDALHAAELDRAVLVLAVAQVLEVDHDVSLRELAMRLPAPWGEVFDSHRDALVAADQAQLPRSLADFLR